MKTILLLTDFSKKADHAADMALSLALKSQSNLLLYNSILVPEILPLAETVAWNGDTFSVIEEDSTNRLKKLAERLENKVDVSGSSFKPSITFLSQMGTIADTISAVVEKHSIWMAIMGTKGDNGVSNFLFGSNAYAAIDKAHCPVLLVPETAPIKRIEKIALATDLKLADSARVDFLTEIAAIYNADIVITHVSSHDTPTDRELIKSMGLINQLVSRLNKTPSFHDIKGADVETRLEEFSMHENVDILAVIHRKHNLLERIFHSSTTKVLISHSKVPLLVLPG